MRRHPVLIFGLILLLLLMWRQPFSPTNSLANLEPFPDTIYYLSGAQNIARDLSFNLNRTGVEIRSPVPVLYSLVLSPLFLVFSDPRSFYLGNMLLALASATLFYFVLERTVAKRGIKTIVFLLFVANPVLSWYPTLAMAENLVLPLFLAWYWLLLAPVTSRRLVLAGVLPLLLLGAKISMVPFVPLLGLAYAGKIWLETTKRREILKRLGILAVVMVLANVALVRLDGRLKHFEPGSQEKNPLRSHYQTYTASLVQTPEASEHVAFWSLDYLNKNLPLYLGTITGGQVPLLQAPFRIMPHLLGPLVALALAANVVLNPALGGFNLLLVGTALPLFATFFVVDFRYIYFLLPVFYLTAALFWQGLARYLAPRPYWRVLYFGTGLLFVGSLFTRAVFVTDRIKANLTPSETAVNYRILTAFNDYFAPDRFSAGPKPKLLTVIPPFYFDYFSSGRYEVLPLSAHLYITPDPTALYGDYDWTSLTGLYQSFLDQGIEVYASPVADQVREEYVRDWSQIVRTFKLEPVTVDCANLCKLYRLTKK